MEALGFPLQQEAVLLTLTEDVVKSSEIEGEQLDASHVRSSIARRLGLDVGGLEAADRHVEGGVDMMLDATRHYDQPLSAERLFGWHASLFPTGRSGMRKIRVGAWRDDGTGPTQVVCGSSPAPRRSIDGAQTTLAAVLFKARTLTTSKWATIATCSSDTALRDIRELVEQGILVRNPEGGRSTSYALAKVAEQG